MFKNQKGFSLIELMVVVAIIGILSAVAVPQFQKFQRKAKQSEAKANLAAIYTAQKIFKIEQNTFYPNLWAIGYGPEGQMTYRLIIFISGGGVSASPNGFSATPYRFNEFSDTLAICGSTFAGGISSDCATQIPTTNGDLANASIYVATATTFRAAAWARIGGSAISDEWSINQRKEVINVVNGAL